MKCLDLSSGSGEEPRSRASEESGKGQGGREEGSLCARNETSLCFPPSKKVVKLSWHEIFDRLWTCGMFLAIFD